MRNMYFYIGEIEHLPFYAPRVSSLTFVRPKPKVLTQGSQILEDSRVEVSNRDVTSSALWQQSCCTGRFPSISLINMLWNCINTSAKARQIVNRSIRGVRSALASTEMQKSGAFHSVGSGQHSPSPSWNPASVCGGIAQQTNTQNNSSGSMSSSNNSHLSKPLGNPPSNYTI